MRALFFSFYGTFRYSGAATRVCSEFLIRAMGLELENLFRGLRGRIILAVLPKGVNIRLETHP